MPVPKSIFFFVLAGKLLPLAEPIRSGLPLPAQTFCRIRRTRSLFIDTPTSTAGNSQVYSSITVAIFRLLPEKF
jgi:hypothetical protein